MSFSSQKGAYMGSGALKKQSAAYQKIMNRDFSEMDVLPRCIMPITLLDRGVMRAGMPVSRAKYRLAVDLVHKRALV